MAASEIEELLAAAARAAPRLAAMNPRARASALLRVADALDSESTQIVSVAARETGLQPERLKAELNRTTCQLRLFAEVLAEGTYLDARLDEADPDYVTGPRPDVRRMNVPVGPVLVFSASNFPLAFSVAGGDVASALAAGCPTVVKAHEGHPELSRLTGDLVTAALQRERMPEGTFAVVTSREAALAALRDKRVRAASFTGSTEVGRQLAQIASARDTPIPFFGELGSLNPVIVTSAALAEHADLIGREYVSSVAGSAGQLCTKPGICFVPDDAPLRAAIVDQLARVPEHRLLTRSISDTYAERRTEVMMTPGAQIVAPGSTRFDHEGFAWVTPTIVALRLSDMQRAHTPVWDEIFGPLSVLVSYEDFAELAEALSHRLPGNLTATLRIGDGDDLSRLAPLVACMSSIAGRVLLAGWPTGVSVTAAMQHGGPYPATTADSTSVGTAAIDRFMRGVAFQEVPSSLLPPPLQDANPWNIPQRRSTAGLSSDWGSLRGRY